MDLTVLCGRKQLDRPPPLRLCSSPYILYIESIPSVRGWTGWVHRGFPQDASTLVLLRSAVAARAATRMALQVSAFSLSNVMSTTSENKFTTSITTYAHTVDLAIWHISKTFTPSLPSLKHASHSQIKSAYHRLLLQSHPDNALINQPTTQILSTSPS
jgi:hypothetical protein